MSNPYSNKVLDLKMEPFPDWNKIEEKNPYYIFYDPYRKKDLEKIEWIQLGDKKYILGKLHTNYKRKIANDEYIYESCKGKD